MRSRTPGWASATAACGFRPSARCLLFVIAFIAMVGSMLPAGPANARRARQGAREAASRAHISAHGFLMALMHSQNIERQRHGLHPLGNAGPLDRAANRHVRDMVRRRYFGHVSPTGSDPLRRALGAGYRGRRAVCVGENILSWPTGLSAGQVVQKFMASPPHRANILGRWSDVGVAMMRHATSGGRGLTVAVEFGRRR
ncbi:MAG: hypothetical protein C5B48_03970 [Candidatus Rokuibacteriota bacterium]|nr:MAG: hypothetical protein C5B48_03970 [Candidatus Rokubacteria bacterium]